MDFVITTKRLSFRALHLQIFHTLITEEYNTTSHFNVKLSFYVMLTTELCSRKNEVLSTRTFHKLLGSESFSRWLVWSHRGGDTTSVQQLGKIRKFFYHLVVFECPHHLTLSALLKLHFFLSKTSIRLRQKAKSNH